MNVVDVWSGHRASALQRALRLTNEGFSERLGTATRTVAKWNANPASEPSAEIQQALDTLLYQAPEHVQARFALLVDAGGTAESPASPSHTDVPRQVDPKVEQRVREDSDIGAALDWLDIQTDRIPGASRREVVAELVDLDIDALQERGHRRGRVDQRDIASALKQYYATGSASKHGTYSVRYADDRRADTSILTSPDWLDLRCPLDAQHEKLTLDAAAEDTSDLELDEHTITSATRRIAETLTTGTRLVNAPLYRLLDIQAAPGQLSGSFGMTEFVRYALTMDLLEGELVDALANGQSIAPGTLPLRERYLPDTESVLDVGNRTCVGGPLALCAFARPADGIRRTSPDYLLLVQERGGRVLNAARRLAVIPKCFHEPMVDYRDDTQLGSTLLRELEEELFGRDDVDSTVDTPRRADPMHRNRLSEPMGWLADRSATDAWNLECTGVGLNLVSGNYEFASLLVVHDEDFWTHYGGHIEANWEADSLRQYSSADPELLTRLLGDTAWSNEGLFAFLQGLRRLSEFGGDRVNSPEIDWEIQS